MQIASEWSPMDVTSRFPTAEHVDTAPSMTVLNHLAQYQPR